MISLVRLDQSVAGPESKFRVQDECVYGELNSVGHPLPGAVVAGPEFEILNSIVCPDTVYVMDGLLGQKFPADVLLHDVAMVENLPSGFSGEVCELDAHVPMSRGVRFAVSSVRVPFGILRAFVKPFARGAAKTSAPIDHLSVAVIHGNRSSALAAWSSVPLASPNPAALGGTVERVLSVLGSVRAKFARVLLKVSPTGLALEGCRNDVDRPSIVHVAMSHVARVAAKLSITELLSGDSKAISALVAGNVDRCKPSHVWFPKRISDNSQYNVLAVGASRFQVGVL